jgi:cytochrome d ubiquinol oxidase subunit II
VVIGASLFAAFPMVYSVFLPAFYIRVLLLLFGLSVRQDRHSVVNWRLSA